jgi:CHAD domain-containing protein
MNTPQMNPPDPLRRGHAHSRARPAKAQVVAGLASAQLQAMAAAMPLLELDRDEEALHDFRVALRRLRTLLQLLGDDRDDRLATQCDRGLRRLTRATGPRRDLDVALRDFAPALPRPDLSGAAVASVTTALQRERRRAQRQLLATLRGGRSRQTLAATERLLAVYQEAPAHQPPPVAKLMRRAGAKLRRRLRRARREPSVARLHAARKAGKRLRYLLEALPALYPNQIRRRAVRSAIADLKALQDALGSICDLGVQAALLTDLSVRHAAAIRRHGGSPAALAQLGGRLQAQADAAASDAAKRLTSLPLAIADDFTALITLRAPRAH